MKEIKKKIKIVVFWWCLFFLLFSFSFAQENEFPQKPQGKLTLEQSLFWVYRVAVWFGILAVLIGLVLAGFKFLTSAGDPSKLKDARDQAIKAILALFFILLIPAILRVINPQFSFENIFSLKQPPPVSVPQLPVQPLPGLYGKTIHDEIKYFPVSFSDATDPKTGDPTEFKEFWIVNGYLDGEVSFGGVLFEEKNFKGYCYEIFSQNTNPVSLNFKVASVVVYSYKKGPVGKVIFYHHPFYDKQGGYLELYPQLPPSWLFLENLEFEGVPDREKKCLQWDEEGNCIHKGLTLEGDAISSIKIDAPQKELSVLMVAKKRDTKEPKCQLFYNKGGEYDAPNIKDEYIRADNGFPYALKILPGKPR